MSEAAPPLPELAAVPWRRRVDERSLRRDALAWRLTLLAPFVPALAAGGALFALQPWTLPAGLALVGHAWLVDELYANRGAGVVRPRRSRAAPDAERVALGLLGDLLDHDARELAAATGLALERGRLGVWLVGPAGALLVRPGGRTVHCFCVGVPDPELPAGDKVAHGLLALRADEAGFATVANRAFAASPRRLRRRLPARTRPALDAAVAAARER
jgi:hypothetical protein